MNLILIQGSNIFLFYYEDNMFLSLYYFSLFIYGVKKGIYL